MSFANTHFTKKFFIAFVAASLIGGIATTSIAAPQDQFVKGTVPTNPSVFSFEVVKDAQTELLDLAGLKSEQLKEVEPSQVKQVNEKFLSVLPNSDMSVYVLTRDQGSSLGIPLLTNAKASKNAFYIVQEYAIYRTLNEKPTPSPRGPFIGVSPPEKADPSAQGISIRMIISVQSKNIALSGLSIGSLALAAEKKDLTANVSLQTVGIIGQKITEATPMPSELNFTTLSNMYRGMDEIKQAIWTQPTGSLVFLRPQIIRRVGNFKVGSDQ